MQRLLLAHGFHSQHQIKRLISFYFYKNIVLVGCEITFQFVNGFSKERFFITFFISAYNLVLSTLQSLVAILFEHRKLREKLQIVEPGKYMANLEHFSKEHRTFWRWIAYGFFHGIAIGVITLHLTESKIDDDGRTKEIGFKDQSTVAFNIILHVIFLKLSFELDSMNTFAFNLIWLTILFNYLLISIVSSTTIGDMLDPDLVGVGARSIFNLDSLILVIGVCFLTVTFRELPTWVNWIG